MEIDTDMGNALIRQNMAKVSVAFGRYLPVQCELASTWGLYLNKKNIDTYFSHCGLSSFGQAHLTVSILTLAPRDPLQGKRNVIKRHSNSIVPY